MKKIVLAVRGFLIAAVGACLIMICILLLENLNQRAKEDLVKSLKTEKQVAELNAKLKSELSAITRERYIELKAKERIGVTKPNAEEILVLRHEGSEKRAAEE